MSFPGGASISYLHSYCFLFYLLNFCLYWLMFFVVLDTDCFERLLGKCTKLLERSISDYRYLDDDLRSYYNQLKDNDHLQL